MALFSPGEISALESEGKAFAAGTDFPGSVKEPSPVFIRVVSSFEEGKMLLIPILEDKKTAETASKSTMHIS
ncbi:MAG: hypothetical protein GY737_19630 [Desulfobacteraceae bacterium]|nr:hypothetical protein [Desulfobacteraceae bacterium]